MDMFYDEDYDDTPWQKDPDEYIIELIEVETDKALLVKTKKGKFWVPKSISFIEDKYLFTAQFFKPKYIKEEKSPFTNVS